MIKEAIIKIVNKEDLSYDEAYAVMNEVMSGESSQVQNAAFLAAMSTKSAKAETTDETAQRPLTFLRFPRWSRRRAASKSRSTETARHPRTAVRRTSSRPPASTLTRVRNSARSYSTR